jgi:hypothetical protein
MVYAFALIAVYLSYTLRIWWVTIRGSGRYNDHNGG